MRRIHIAAVLALCATTLFPAAASACSCTPGAGAPACEQDLAKRTVFVGKVVRVGGLISELLSSIGTDSHYTQPVDLELLETLNGSVPENRVRVYTTSSSAACGYAFEKGETYVVYAYNDGGRLTVSLCSRTAPRKYREEDIAYFRGLSKAPEPGRIYGTFKRYTYDPNFKPTFQPSIMDHYRPPEETYRAMAPMSGTVLKIKGNGQEYKVTVDGKGRWALEQVAPGKYEIVAVLPKNLIPVAENVGVRAKGCAERNLRTESDGHIKGYLRAPKPIDSYHLVQVALFRAGEPLNVHEPFNRTLPDRKTGAFEMGPLPPGRYLLAAFLHGKDFSSASVFYPGVSSAEKAQIIELGDGEVIGNLELKPE